MGHSDFMFRTAQAVVTRKCVLIESLARTLDDALNASFVALVGPTGCGKTEAVRAWLEDRALPHQWLSLKDMAANASNPKRTRAAQRMITS